MNNSNHIEENCKQLEKVFNGDKSLLLFFISWIKNNKNATKAYLELHPGVTYESATVLGSRQLGKVNISTIMEIYGVGIQEYFTQLKEGHNAMKWNDFTGEREPDHKTRESYSKRIGRLLGIESDNSSIKPIVVGEPMRLEFVLDERA